MAKTLGQFAVGMANLATGLPADMEAATNRAALKVTTAARASIKQASGGDNRLSGGGQIGKKRRPKAGYFVGAGYDMAKAGTYGRSASALVHMRGVLWILDNPTKAHDITPKAKAGRVRPLALSNGGFAYRVHVRGTRGKRSFWTAVDRVSPQVPRIYQDALASSMVKRLK